MNFKYVLFIIATLFIDTSCKAQASRLSSDKEIPPAQSAPCFPGAYYRKAVSSFDEWSGITGVVILGYPKVDENRLNDKTGQPLDNFSVYMGGNADGAHEVDAGLTWEFSTDSTGNLSKRRNSWRPFWRVTGWNSAPNRSEFVWRPGDTLQMTVKMAGSQKLRMVITDMHHPKKKFQVDFDAPGFTFSVLRQFKRVNAIDQSHNEGKPVQPTHAMVTGAKWLQTNLLRGRAEKQLPMNKHRFTDMRCSDASHVKITTTNESTGAEEVDIFGTP